jgi:trehalose synthase
MARATDVELPMPNTTLHCRFLRVALIAVCTVLSGHQTSFSQTSAPTQGPEYLAFLEKHSMLHQASQVDELISGEGVQWRNDYGRPEPDTLKEAASVWLLYYPGSVITSPGESVIRTLADPQFWSANTEIGINLLHTNPTERAGGIRGRTITPTIDGWFDRIGLNTAPELGTEEDFKELVTNAGQAGAIIAGDLVPLHTGLGPDFRLAERGYRDYIGLYDMVEINKEDWGLLPQVDDPWGTALVPRDAAIQLKEKGYIPGLIQSADAASGANEWSGWSATPEVMGADGRPRRSVYLHIFKPTQPTLNWLDPTYGARRVQFGDAGRNILLRGVRVLRLDADTFLGLEPVPESQNASAYLTPLARVSATDTAFMIRKLGGWSYQEFAAPLAQLKEFAPNGPDLSYDFFTRAEALVPLITGDALPLRLGHHFLLEAGVPAGTLIHDLQNHDEITFQLFELGAHDEFEFEGQTLNGKQLKEQILETMRTRVAGDAAPYNLLYRPEQDGVATTFAGFIAPALGVQDPYHATPDQVALIQRGHLLLAHANAMIPGVFAISAWDLVGALPIPLDSVPSELTAGNDFRWVNRGGVDLLNANPTATASAVLGLPKATALYGPLPDQLANPNSFASQMKMMLAARKQYRIDESEITAVPPVGDPGVCVLVMRLPDSAGLAITALNYGRNSTSVDVTLTEAQPVPGQPGVGSGGGSGSAPGIATDQIAAQVPQSMAGQPARDIITGQDAGTVSADGRLTIMLEPLSGRTIVIGPAASTSVPTTVQ